MIKFGRTANVAAVAVNEAPNDQGVVNTATEGETQKAHAIALALRESEEMETTIEAVAKAKEDWQGGPIAVLFALRENYGDDIDTFPVPDLETGNNPDKFKIEVTDANGKATMRATSFYQVFADATKQGKAIVDELAYIKRAGNAEAVKTDIPEAILDMTIDQRETRTNYLNGRRSTIKRSYKNAMALYHQMNAIASMPLISCDFVWVTDDKGDDTDVVENTTKPIVVWQRPAEGKPIKEREFFSIGSLLKLDPNKALEKGGTFKELKKTVARATGGATGNNQEVPPIKTAETFVGRFVEAFRFMDEMQSDPDQKEMGKLMKLLNHKDAAELKVTVVEFRNYLDDIVDEMKLNAWYADLQAKLDPLVTRKAS